MFMADDIRIHGNPLHYAEDAFEKNHHTVRTGIIHQNGHAKSRDTACQFAKYELILHLTAGGFCKHGDTWYPPGKKVSTEGQNQKIINFLAINSEDDSAEKCQKYPLRSMDRHTNGKPLNKSSEPVFQLQAMQAILACHGDCSIMEGNDCRILSYQKVVSISGRYASVGDFVVFCQNEEEHIGKMTAILDISVPRRMSYKAAQICVCNLSGEVQQKLILGEEKVRITVAAIKETLHAVHDCKQERCCHTELPAQTRMEQELVNVAKNRLNIETVEYIF